MENCCRLVFYHNIYSFYAYFLWNFLGKLRERENENNKLRNHNVISMVCYSVLSSAIPLGQSVRDKSLSYRKTLFFAIIVEILWCLLVESNIAFSLTWPASMEIYWSKRKCLHTKRVQHPQDWFGNTNMAAVVLFWNTNMAAVTSCENA